MTKLRHLLPLLLVSATPVLAADPSVTCSVELVRSFAIASSDYKESYPSGLWWVGLDGKSLGPWSVMDIKRRMNKGELPTEVYVYALEGKEWLVSTQVRDFVPLPGNSALAPQEIQQTLAQLLTGCWVSDPVSEAAGQETVWMFMLFDANVFMPLRGVMTAATGGEGFWFNRSSNARWQIVDQTNEQFTLSLPDIDFFHPQDDFAAQLIDRNQLKLDIPGIGGVIFRRM